MNLKDTKISYTDIKWHMNNTIILLISKEMHRRQIFASINALIRFLNNTSTIKLAYSTTTSFLQSQRLVGITMLFLCLCIHIIFTLCPSATKSNNIHLLCCFSATDLTMHFLKSRQHSSSPSIDRKSTANRREVTCFIHSWQQVIICRDCPEIHTHM